MEKQEVEIKDNMRIVLKANVSELDEIVVIGYGSGKKLGSVVGSIGRVDNEAIEKSPTVNFTDALSGQVSGLSVLSSSGDPTAAASIRLRGMSSISAGTTPLFILDGAPISSSVFNTLNPNDIENVTVLKDAASTAIYGSRAANGVVIITSKKGKLNEKATVTVRAQAGFSGLVKDQLEMMNSEQYIRFRDLIGMPVDQSVKDLVANYGISTNWRNEFFDGSAPTYSIDASIDGGGANNTYFVSVNHTDQQGIIDQSGIRRETVRFNFDSRVKDWLKVGLQSNLGYSQFEQNNEISADALYTSNPAMLSRIALPYDSPRYYTFNENGDIVYGEQASWLPYSNAMTPWFVNNNRDVQRRIVTANLNLYEEFTPIKGLTIRTQQALDAYDYNISNQGFPTADVTTPMTGSTVLYPAAAGYRQESFSRYYSFTYTNTAEYKFNIKDIHHFTVLAGEESIITKTNGFGVFTSGQSDVRQMRLDQGTSVTLDDLTHSQIKSVFNSYFFTANYDFDEKYYFTGSFRRDGSSKFAPGHRWGTFYSVGGMWDAKKEAFLDSVDWLNELQLKVSYGTSGNSSIDDYLFYGLLGSGSNYNGEASLGLSQASNYDLTWETIASANVGLTFRMFDRLGVALDIYHRKTTDMLMSIPYSYTTGYGSGAGNIGAMVNKGFDLDIDLNLMKTRDFNWNLRANFNYNRNEITELFNGRDEFSLPDYGLCYKVGHSAAELYMVRRAGVDPRDGKQVWYDKDGNLTKVYNEERDAVLIGKEQIAPWYGGFGTDLSWKGITVSADFVWQAQKYMMSNENYFLENANEGVSSNQTTRMLNVWTTPGQVTDIPAYGEQIQFDDHLVENASFMRLKNLTVQYALPSSWLRKADISAAKVFFTGRNLWTVTNYTGYDPEPDTNMSQFRYPNTKQFIFGLELTF